MTAARTHCNACHKALLGSPQRVAAATECDFCGVVFAKLQRASSRPLNSGEKKPTARRLPQPGPPASSSTPVLPSAIGSLIANHGDHVRSWAGGRMPLPRIPVLLFMAYLGIRYLLNSEYHTIFDGINLAIHEAGHLVFGIFPRFMMIFGGTLLQLALPVICAVVLHRQTDYFGVSFCGCWLGANFYNVAIYQADAQAQILPLVTVGGGVPIHDWHYMLDQLGLLSWDSQVAFLTRCLGFCLIWGSVTYGAWLIRIIRQESQKDPLQLSF